jgi:hypothetical protein
MSPLTRDEFAEEIRRQRPDLADEFLEQDAFGGETLFFRHESTIIAIALRPTQKLLWVMGVLGGGLEWLWELKKFGLSNGYEWLGFKVKRGLPWGKAIARYGKARLMAATPSGDEYCASLHTR